MELSLFATTIMLAIMNSFIICEAGSCNPDPPTRPWVRVNYSVWRQNGPNPAEFRADTSVLVPLNATFYQVMQVAQVADKTFSLTEGSGHHITSINGMFENENYSWVLYLVPKHPDPARPPTTDFETKQGVDKTFVKEDDHFLLWLRHKKYHW